MNILTALPYATVATFALNVLFGLTILCLLTLCAARGLFRHNPSLRYAICLTGIVAALLLPLALRVTDSAGLTVAPLLRTSELSLPATPPTPPANAIATGTTISTPEPVSSQEFIAAVTFGATFLWAVGLALGTLRLIAGWGHVRRIMASARRWESPLRGETQQTAERVLGRRLPTVFVAPGLTSPVAVGLLRPRIVLPEGMAETLNSIQLRQILLHECAHVAFRHSLSGVAEKAIRLIFWPHPLAHALCWELARAREEVCDNVASQEAGAACYARTLLAIAQGMTTAPNSVFTLALLGPETSLEKRITGLLHPRRNRMTEMKRRQLWAVAGAATLAVGLTTTIRLVSAADKAKTDTVASFDKPDAFWVKRLAEAKARKAKDAGRPAGQRAASGDTLSASGDEAEREWRTEQTMSQSKVQLDQETARWIAASPRKLDKAQLDEAARWIAVSKLREAKLGAEAKAQEAQPEKRKAEKAKTAKLKR